MRDLWMHYEKNLLYYHQLPRRNSIPKFLNEGITGENLSNNLCQNLWLHYCLHRVPLSGCAILNYAVHWSIPHQWSNLILYEITIFNFSSQIKKEKWLAHRNHLYCKRWYLFFSFHSNIPISPSIVDALLILQSIYRFFVSIPMITNYSFSLYQ